MPAKSPFHFPRSFLIYLSYSSSVSFLTFFFAIGAPLWSCLSTIMDGFCKDYSVRRAMTGSFFAADCAGMSPETSVSTTLTSTMMNAVPTGSAAMPAMPASE